MTRPQASTAAVASRMGRQRRRDTRPELEVRRLLHAKGLRYRVAWPIPGLRRRTIDIAFTRCLVAVFLDGCFWHGCPEHGTSPRANSTWWQGKLEANRERDRTTTAHLRLLGWTVIRAWEHEHPSDGADRVVASLAASP